MNILKISRLSMLWFCLLAIACAEDKGNYTYEEVFLIDFDSGCHAFCDGGQRPGCRFFL